jgi:hypothetical protein
MELKEEDVVEFYIVLDKVVSADGPWKDKKAKLVNEASTEDRINLEEFIGWFGDSC